MLELSTKADLLGLSFEKIRLAIDVATQAGHPFKNVIIEISRQLDSELSQSVSETVKELLDLEEAFEAVGTTVADVTGLAEQLGIPIEGLNDFLASLEQQGFDANDVLESMARILGSELSSQLQDAIVEFFGLKDAIDAAKSSLVDFNALMQGPIGVSSSLVGPGASLEDILADPEGINRAIREAQEAAGLSFDRGGVVPGPVGALVAATVHGGETVRTPTQEAALGQGGNMGFRIFIGDREIADFVVEVVNDRLGMQALRDEQLKDQ